MTDNKTDSNMKNKESPMAQMTPDVILGIETSCDETAAAIVTKAEHINSSVVSSQISRHQRFGGVVPEIASRSHLEMLLPVIEEAVGQSGKKPEAVAATSGPGLAGALLVGFSAGKALSLAWDIPFVSVNHLEAHLYAPLLESENIEFPFLVLLVSGGHTLLAIVDDHGCYKVIGETRDDAAGEAFDKTARALGLGYPGGPEIDKLAKQGDAAAVNLPRPMLKEGFDFSFSGLKTAVVNYLRSPEGKLADKASVAASFQAAVVDVLVGKTLKAVEVNEVRGVCLAGGVAANSLLRQKMAEICADINMPLAVPGMDMCTDNAAMVAAAGWWRLKTKGPSSLSEGIDSSARL